VLAACGGSASSSAPAGGGSSPAATVSVKSIGNIGRALVSGDGSTLYTSDVEAGGMIRCTGACTSFWKPLAPGGASPTARGDTGRLGVIKRPDGSRQVTANGRPLYTFAEEGPGQIKGNGFTDVFAGRHFVWHAVVAGGTPAGSRGSGASASGSGGSGYSGGGY
jgi:predicted lipoprotein with Yx(FWY)xxD motif